MFWKQAINAQFKSFIKVNRLKNNRFLIVWLNSGSVSYNVIIDDKISDDNISDDEISADEISDDPISGNAVEFRRQNFW